METISVSACQEVKKGGKGKLCCTSVVDDHFGALQVIYRCTSRVYAVLAGIRGALTF